MPSCTTMYGASNDVMYSTTTRDGHPGSRTVAAFVRGFLPSYARLSVGLQTNNLSWFRGTRRFRSECRTPMARVVKVRQRSRPKRNEMGKKFHRLSWSCVLNVPSIPGGGGRNAKNRPWPEQRSILWYFQLCIFTARQHVLSLSDTHLTTRTLSSVTTVKYKFIITCVAILPRISS